MVVEIRPWMRYYIPLFYVAVAVKIIPESKVHGAYLGPTGPRWAPCWPHELYTRWIVRLNNLPLKIDRSSQKNIIDNPEAHTYIALSYQIYALIQCLPFCRRHSKQYFIDRKLVYFDSNFTVISPHVCTL